MIAGLFDAYSLLEIGTYKPSSVDWVAEVYTRLKVTLLSLVSLLISDFFPESYEIH